MSRRKFVLFAISAVTLLMLSTLPAAAQNRAKGPWWPHPLWGAKDQAGASNWITPETVLRGIELVQRGKVYPLGQVYEPDMPFFGERSYKMRIPGAPTYGPLGKNTLVANEEFLCTEIGQVGTQFDGLAHIGMQMTMDDGSVKDVYYNGYTGAEVVTPYGVNKLGVEHVKPIVTRGILIDIAGLKRTDRLENSYEVTLADVRAALKRQGLAEENIENGDALFFNYGWSSLWHDPEAYNVDPPGIGLEVARWVAARNVSMIGSDSFTTEVSPNPDPGLAIPVHQELMMKNGIFNLENLKFDGLIEDDVYEFLFVFSPVPFKGATGSPGQPIAIR